MSARAIAGPAGPVGPAAPPEPVLPIRPRSPRAGGVLTGFRAVAIPISVRQLSAELQRMRPPITVIMAGSMVDPTDTPPDIDRLPFQRCPRCDHFATVPTPLGGMTTAKNGRGRVIAMTKRVATALRRQ